MKEPRVYKTSPVLLVVIAFVFLFFFGLVVFAFDAIQTRYLIPFLAFMILIFGILFVALMSKTIISDDEISVQGLLGTKTLHWMDIGRVSGWGDGMNLHSRDEDVKMSINSRMPGYQEVIEVIGSKRPDLFSPREYAEMRRGVGFFVSMGVIALLFIGFMFFFVWEFFSSGELSLETLVPFGVIFLMLLAFGGMFLSIPRVVQLEGSQLTLRYLLNERTIRADEVRFIELRYTQSRNGKHYFIFLQLTDGKGIRLSGLSISLPVAYLVLRNWHQDSMKHSQIAPNWSDNSRN